MLGAGLVLIAETKSPGITLKLLAALLGEPRKVSHAEEKIIVEDRTDKAEDAKGKATPSLPRARVHAKPHASRVRRKPIRRPNRG